MQVQCAYAIRLCAETMRNGLSGRNSKKENAVEMLIAVTMVEQCAMSLDLEKLLTGLHNSQWVSDSKRSVSPVGVALVTRVLGVCCVNPEERK